MHKHWNQSGGSSDLESPAAARSLSARSRASTSMGTPNPPHEHRVTVTSGSSSDQGSGSPSQGPRSHASAVLIAGAAYILSSSCLILFNKHALSSFHFQCPNALLAFHCLLAAALVKACEVLGYVKLEPLRWSIVRLWLPVNLIFVGMLVTSFFALRHVGVAMFTVLKNLSNIITATGDWWFYGRTYSLPVWSCMALMIVSAACGGLTDVKFTLEGYVWQLINCVFTSAYALYLSGVMERVAPHTSDGKRMGEFSMVYYNNLLSIGPILLLMIGFGEVQALPRQEALRNPEFLTVAMLGGLLGFSISFTSLWYMSRSTATVFSLTGSLNKVVVAIAGILLFQEAAGVRNLISIGVGLLAGVVFVFAKTWGPK